MRAPDRTAYPDGACAAPAGHGRTGRQAACPAAGWNVAPTTHGVHASTGCAAADPGAQANAAHGPVCPGVGTLCPGAHATHGVCPLLSASVAPAGHGRQRRSLVGVGNARSSWPGLHSASAWHARSVVALGVTASTWKRLHVLSGKHCASTVPPHARRANWPALHAVHGRHVCDKEFCDKKQNKDTERGTRQQ